MSSTATQSQYCNYSALDLQKIRCGPPGLQGDLMHGIVFFPETFHQQTYQQKKWKSYLEQHINYYIMCQHVITTHLKVKMTEKLLQRKWLLHIFYCASQKVTFKWKSLKNPQKIIAAFRNTKSTAKLPAAGSMCTGGHYDHDISSLCNFVRGVMKLNCTSSSGTSSPVQLLPSNGLGLLFGPLTFFVRAGNSFICLQSE